MKNSKKCQNNNANSMNEAQLESVQGGVGIPAGWTPGDGARTPMTLEENNWALYGARNKIQPRGGKEIQPRKGIQPR